jgi:hypothetical protein
MLPYMNIIIAATVTRMIHQNNNSYAIHIHGRCCAGANHTFGSHNNSAGRASFYPVHVLDHVDTAAAILVVLSLLS